jgi:hypothetical protein
MTPGDIEEHRFETKVRLFTFLRSSLILPSAVVSALLTSSVASAETMDISPGWNLVGIGNDVSLNVAGALGDATKVNTVWKWVAATSTWAFYAPSLVGSALTDYAQSKGYDVLATVDGGEGFWVNAKLAHTINFSTGSTILASAFRPSGSKPLVQGWNLISTGETKTPSAFNATLSSDVTTLWAWKSSTSGWYFYAPSLDRSGGLGGYISSKGYLDFTATGKTLGMGLGFWVNNPTPSCPATQVLQNGICTHPPASVFDSAIFDVALFGKDLPVGIFGSATFQ